MAARLDHARWIAARHRPHIALALLVAGLALAPAGWAVAANAAAAAGGAGLLAARATAAPLETSAVPRWAVALIACQLVLLGTAVGELRLAAIERPVRAAPTGAIVEGRAVLIERPRPGLFGWSAVVRVETGRAAGLRALARFAPRLHPPKRIGSRMALRALVARPRRARDGFDYDAFLRSRGVLRQIEVLSLRPLGVRGGAGGAIDRARERAESALSKGRHPGRAALARGMVLGQDDAVDEAVRDDFRRSGLAHLLAASGQNVMLLCALALPLLALAGFGHVSRGCALIALIALYVPLAGAGASILRAGVMGAAGVVAMLAGRPSSRVYALLLAAAVTLVLNPRVTGDPAWQLSFAAVAGIAAGARPLAAAIGRGLEPPRPAAGSGRGSTAVRLRAATADAVAITLSATIATAPLMAHHFEAVSVAALPANLLAAPAVAPLMWVGMVQAALGQAGDLGIVAARPLSVAGDPLVAWVAWVAERLAQPVWAQTEVRLGWLGVVAASGCIAAALVAIRLRPRPDPGARPNRTLPALAAAAVAAALVLASVPAAQPRGLRVDFLDVGQGDATLIRDGKGAAVLFDGGPPEAHVARTLARLGVRRLSAVVATHQSRDHHGGLAEVIRRFPVDVFVDGGDGTTDPTFLELANAARERGVRRVPARDGVRLRAGELRIGLLAPRARPPGAPPADANERATVALVSHGAFDLLMTADAESPALLPLELPPVEALKVPHHGSSDPGLAAVLARTRPRIAAIEVGEGNRYGHPAPSTLAALGRAGARVFRTDRDGAVTLEVDGGEVVVRAGR